MFKRRSYLSQWDDDFWRFPNDDRYTHLEQHAPGGIIMANLLIGILAFGAGLVAGLVIGG